MKRLFPFIAAVFLINGCFAQEEKTALEYIRSESNQTTHYRPVHRLHDDWSIRKLGATLTLNADDRRIKVSSRHGEKKVVIRDGNGFFGTITKNEDVIHLIGRENETLEMTCISEKSPAIAVQNKTVYVTPTGSGIAARGIGIKKIGRKKFSIVESHQPNTCQEKELELPFSELGALIFQIDDIPLPQRMGLAWFVSEFDADCSHPGL